MCTEGLWKDIKEIGFTPKNTFHALHKSTTHIFFNSKDNQARVSGNLGSTTTSTGFKPYQGLEKGH